MGQRVDSHAEALTKEPTLQGMIDKIVSNGGAETEGQRPFEPSGVGSADLGRAPLPRFTVKARPTTTDAGSASPPLNTGRSVSAKVIVLPTSVTVVRPCVFANSNA